MIQEKILDTHNVVEKSICLIDSNYPPFEADSSKKKGGQLQDFSPPPKKIGASGGLLYGNTLQNQCNPSLIYKNQLQKNRRLRRASVQKYTIRISVRLSLIYKVKKSSKKSAPAAGSEFSMKEIEFLYTEHNEHIHQKRIGKY